MKKILSNISATTLLLIFLFFCGTLYIISYWSTFDFDITNYIELFDIPKSFVYPLGTGMGISVVSLLAQTIVKDSQIGKASKTVDIAEEKRNAFFARFKWVSLSFVTLVALLACMMFYERGREWIIIIMGLSFSGWAFLRLNRNAVIIKTIPDARLRMFFSVMIGFVPIYSFGKGKLDSVAVWKNEKYYTIVNIVYADSSGIIKDVIGKKLLGKLGSNLIVTDNSNSSITVVNLEKVGLIQYNLNLDKQAIP